MAEQEKVLFIVGGKKVDGLGRVNGEAPAPVGESVTALKARIAELEAQLAGQDQGNPDSTDTRTIPELKAALDAKQVAYPASANKAALQALAAENKV